ncbi:hypothetical protein BW721_10665 [Jeotgalibaca sp. PTS2502]|uniref:GNAT family N-acetyltransferase n=1 Tax=Jeotgalibaca sp. PTS2502 TaxID=1903686 RepID=UPI0009737FCE|nr:GNAT family N-acetyltransferase [Jeotgalibaca sp. PTS2502]APZ50045.1 hypothetical protein BW721_10665 [Jeotgalibaca sp. PTS2502]
MDYKLIPTEHLDQVVKLKDYCFVKRHEADHMDDIGPWLEIGAGLGGYDGKELASQLLIHPLEMNVFGHRYPMGGIAMVSTYPEYRQGGVTKGLLQAAFKKMKKDGQILSVLSPFSIGFYRHFGYEVFFENSNYSIPVEKMALRQEASGRVVRFDYESDNCDDCLPKIKAFHQTIVEQTNGYMVRDDRWWNRLRLREPFDHFGVSLNQMGEVDGYVRYVWNKPQLEITDFHVANGHAMRVLWQYIQSHQSQISTVVGKSSLGDSLAFHLKEPVFERSGFYDMMIRIVDVEAFLKDYAFKKRHQPLYVSIEDPHADWNQAVFKIDTDGQVKKVLAVQDDSLLKMAIGPFSALMAGYQSLDWYRQFGYAEVTDQQAKYWQAAIPYGNPRFNDFF